MKKIELTDEEHRLLYLYCLNAVKQITKNLKDAEIRGLVIPRMEKHKEFMQSMVKKLEDENTKGLSAKEFYDKGE